MDLEIITNSAQETIDLGRRTGSQLRGGEIFALTGQLGSGKTHFVKGLAAGAGSPEASSQVSSPTFVLVNEYIGDFHIYHIDAYRLESSEEFSALGFDDYCRPDSVVLIEWADRVSSALAGLEIIELSLSHIAPQQRRISVCGLPEYISKG